MSVLSMPEGSSSLGGNFEFEFAVLPGDTDQSGLIRANDGFASLQLVLQDIGSDSYLAFADFDGSGTIRANDGFFSLQRIFTETSPDKPNAPIVGIPAAIDAICTSLPLSAKKPRPGLMTSGRSCGRRLPSR